MFFRNIGERNQAKSRITRIFRLLNKKYKIASERIFLRVFKNSPDSFTQLWIYPKEASLDERADFEVIKGESFNTKKQ